METWKRIDKYQINLKKLLGQGSYASVYLGRSTETGETVAVKVIERRLFMDSYNLKNLQSEIQILKKVHHENIVKLHDVYQTSNNMYIITELCEDGDLCTYLELHSHKLTQADAKRTIKQIMKGAKYLHQNGIIHRDLKPANILIKNGVCKISDFGFARHLGHSTIMKSIVGTPLYMSPQLLKGIKYTSKSDLWSIGLIYYQMLHGRTPWPANNQIQLLNAINTRKPVYSREISEVSRDFIERCLQIHQLDRMSWEEAFEHKLLKEFSRAPNQNFLKEPVHPNSNKQNSNFNRVSKESDHQITYIKNVPSKLKKELSERALGNLIQHMTPSKSSNRTMRTPSRSRTVAKFAGSRITSGTTTREQATPIIGRKCS